MAEYKVVDIEQLEAGLTATADAIRAKTGAAEEIPWDGATGMAANIEEVFEAGKKSEYDAFWDAYQENGTRQDYRSAFAGIGWNEETFKPKYDIRPTKLANGMCFASRIKDMPSMLAKFGVKLDTSQATNLNTLFGGSYAIRRVPEISTISATDIKTMFEDCPNLETIDKLILKADGSQTINNLFRHSGKIVSIVIEGVIGQNGFDIQWSTKLSKVSIQSIINALSTTTTDLTATLSLTAVNTAFETSTGAADGSTSEEWLALANTKSNWNIALI